MTTRKVCELIVFFIASLSVDFVFPQVRNVRARAVAGHGPSVPVRSAARGSCPAAPGCQARVARRIPAIAPATPRGYKYPVTFEVDLKAPHCVRQINGAKQPEPTRC